MIKMVTEFEFKPNEYGHELVGRNHRLIFFKDEESSSGKKFVFYDHRGEIQIPITGRDLPRLGYSRHYHWDLMDLTKGSFEGRCLEVGAGLGEFAPMMAQSGKKVTVVDPADYNLMIEMMGVMRGHLSSERDILEGDFLELDELVQRADTILNNPNVDFYNMKLSEFIVQNPSHLNSVDVLVDNFGPTYHYQNEGKIGFLEVIGSLHLRLLKKGGLFYYDKDQKYHKINGELK